MPDFLIDAVFDTLKALPFLFGAFLLMEYLEHHGSAPLTLGIARLGPMGPLGGAVVGCIPQCGLAAAAANLFAARLISPGTLLAVFLAASDEAAPMLLAAPEAYPILLRLILIKLAAAIVFGFLVDLLIFRRHAPAVPEEGEKLELCGDCGCGEHSILRAALVHTGKLAAFLLGINLLLGGSIAWIGAEQLSRLLIAGSALQPFAAALVGFIPNCGASVLLTRLYLQGMLSFGALTAGLCASAGVGLAVLFRANRSRPGENLLLLLLLYAASVLTGILV